MKSRVMIWCAVALVAIAAIIAFQKLNQSDVANDGRVTFKTKSGDLIQSFLSELTKFGSSLTVTNASPVLRAEWKYAEDSKGFQVFVPQSTKDELVCCFTQVLGEPLRRDQYPHLVYKEDRFGVGIVADLQSDPIHIICLRKGSIP